MKYNRFIVTIILLWSLLPIHGSIKIGNLYYNLDLDEKTAEVTYKDEIIEKDNGTVYRIINKDWDITTVSIPCSVSYEGDSYDVMSIGESAFEGCKKLKKITIPNSVTEIGTDAFSFCTNLRKVSIPNSVTVIGPNAFKDCINLKSVTLPNSITSIEEGTFQGCESLRRITIPYSVTRIGDYAFLFCTNLRKVSIPNSVTEIGTNAFSFCTNLRKVSIPNSVTEIGTDAFSFCTNLRKVCIPNSVNEIGAGAFMYCFNLKNVTIPYSVTYIGNLVFYYCTSLTDATIDNEILIFSSIVEDFIFDKCYRLEKIYYHKGLDVQNLARYTSAELIAYDDYPPTLSSRLSSWLKNRVLVILILFIATFLGVCLWLLITFYRKRKSANSRTQQCPHCGNRIAADSIYCECCGYKIKKRWSLFS